MLTYTKLWELLKHKNINPSDLYKLCGVHPTTINKMKTGANIETDSINKICSYFNCQPSAIMNYIPDNE